MFDAVSKGDAARVTALLHAGPSLSSPDRHGHTPLMVAARKGYLEVARILLEHGADVDVTGANTALTLATINGHEDVVRLLLEHGADVHRRTYYGRTALILAAEQGQISIARLLLVCGADVNVMGWASPLMYAARHGHENVVRLLLEYGADVNARTPRGRGKTALIMAAEAGRAEIVRLLLAWRADVRGEDRDIARILAMRAGHRDVAALLSDTGIGP